MAITASLVKELREKTNVGMMECKKALSETEGDIDKAIKLLRERGAIKAAKKADRETNEGAVATTLSADGKKGILYQINCETDFVSRNDNFKAYVEELGACLIATDASCIDSALAAKQGEGTVDEYMKAKVLELGESLKLSSFASFSIDGEGAISSYIHMGGKVGVLLEVTTGNAATVQSEEFKALVKDVNLHIAAAAPSGLCREDVPADLVEAEKDIFRKQMEGQNKPADILEKIITGKLGKFYSEQCLLEQGFVKEPDTKIADLVAKAAKSLGDTIEIKRFDRQTIA